MFNRTISKDLQRWADSKTRKPLVLRGARQVGKTTAIRMFSRQFDTYIPLNLELKADREIFTKATSPANLLDSIFFTRNIQRNSSGRTLIFIDEIQKSSEAVAMLRYFHEEAPHLFVVAAGSLLETIMDTQVSFPVGRVEFMLLHPFSFEEFIGALKEEAAVQALNTIPIPDYAHEKLTSLFKMYMLIGGMPEAIKVFTETGLTSSIDTVHESLIIAYLEDVEKYARSQRIVPIIRHIIGTAWNEAAGRIRYDGFGNSNYKSKDIKEAFSVLQKAFLFQVVHPVTATALPIMADTKKSPRLHALDTGLFVFKTNMRKNLFTTSDVSTVFSGRIIEHIVGQEIYAISSSPLHSLNFWVRNKNQSNAEIDYILPVNGCIIPIEVKSGANGRLRSLHAFINAANHTTAVRLYGGPFKTEQQHTIDGKKFTLINIPWYQASKVEEYVGKFM